MSQYEELVEAIARMSDDQYIYEKLLTEELQGMRHEEIVALAKKLCGDLKAFVELGEQFADTLPPDNIAKFIEAVKECQDLLIPPKVFGGFCPCLKPARSGPEYDKRFLLAQSKMVASAFMCEACVIGHKAEALFEDANNTDYSTKMNQHFKTLGEITSQGSDKVRIKARAELLAASEGVSKFIAFYFDDEHCDARKSSFSKDALSRIAKTQEMLNPPSSSSSGGSGSPSNKAGGGASNAGGIATPKAGAATGTGVLSARILIKAQSSLQEILNSAAAMSFEKARDTCNELEDLSEELKGARAFECAQFAELKKRMIAADLNPELSALKEDCETSYTGTSSQILHAKKRWEDVKKNSKSRPVAEYDESEEIKAGGASSGMGSIAASVPDLDPAALGKNMGKAMSKVGTGGKNVMKGALSTVVGIAQLVKEDLTDLAGGGGGSGEKHTTTKKKSSGTSGAKKK